MSNISGHLNSTPPEKRLYLLETLPTHLANAGQAERLRHVLSDFGFLEAKVALFGPHALIADFELSNDSTLRAIQRALQQDASLLDESPDLLWQQLYNRLYWVGDPFPQLFTREMQCRKDANASPWLRRRTPFFESQALLYTVNIVSHSFQVCTIENETYIVARTDQTLRFWDIQTGSERIDRRFNVPFAKGAWRDSGWVISDDGTCIASIYDNDKIMVWDTKNQLERTIYIEYEARIKSFMIDGDFIMAITDDNALTVSDMRTTQKHAVYNHNYPINHWTISPDGLFIVTYDGGFYSSDYSLYIWNTRLKCIEVALKRFDKSVKSCIFSPNGSFLVSWAGDPGGHPDTIKVWDVQNWGEIILFKDAFEEINTCVFSPDNLFMAVASGFADSRENFLTIFDTQTWSIQATLEGHVKGVHDCSFSSDGSIFISASLDGTLKVWDTSMWQERATLRGHGEAVWRCAITSDGSKALSSTINGALKVWDLRSIQIQDNPSLHKPASDLTSCAISSDGSFVVTGNFDGTLKVWDFHTLRELATLYGHAERVGCTISSDGSFMVSFDNEGTLKIWDVQTWQERVTLRGHDASISTCIISPDNSFIVSVSVIDRTLKIWDVHTWKSNTWRTTSFDLTEVAISPDSSFIVSNNGNGQQGQLRIHDIWRGVEGLLHVKLRGEFSRDNELFSEAAVSPDGSFIVTSSFNRNDLGRGFIITLDSKNLREQFVSSDPYLIRPTISPDGKFIISTGRHTHELKIWEPQTGREKITLKGHTDSITAWRVSPDGAFIVTTSNDLTLRIWSLQTGQEMAKLPLSGAPRMDRTLGLELHPWLPSFICGSDNALSLWFIDLIGIVYGPIIVTAVNRGHGFEVCCPKCQHIIAIDKRQLGHEMRCQQSECSLQLRLNPFVIKMQNRPGSSPLLTLLGNFLSRVIKPWGGRNTAPSDTRPNISIDGIFTDFTYQSRQAMDFAREEAQRFQHSYIGTEHLLLGLVREGESEAIAAKVLSDLGVELNEVRSAVEFLIGRGDNIVFSKIDLTPRAKKAIELAVDEAHLLNHHYVGIEHLLLGLVREGGGIAAGVLESLGIHLEKVRTQVLQISSQEDDTNFQRLK